MHSLQSLIGAGRFERENILLLKSHLEDGMSSGALIPFVIFALILVLAIVASRLCDPDRK